MARLCIAVRGIHGKNTVMTTINAAAKPKTFHETISPLLALKLKRFEHAGVSLTREVCLQIYNEIFQVFVSLVQASGIKLTNESVNYIAQQYYDAILINGRQELDPEIFTERAKLDNIMTPELKILGLMLRGTDHLIPVVQVLRTRGQG